ncbi:MAG TPA: hypothetical protein VI319_06585, partial [Burkholderiales bacterium]
MVLQTSTQARGSPASAWRRAAAPRRGTSRSLAGPICMSRPFAAAAAVLGALLVYAALGTLVAPRL